MQYFSDNFADFATDWTNRYNTASPDFSVSGGDLAYPAGKAGDWVGYTWNDVEDSNHRDIEFLVEFTTASTSTLATYPLVFRASGADETPSLFTFYVYTANNRIRLSYCSASDSATEIASSTSVTLANSTRYRARIRINGASPTTVQARIWPYADSEPGTWQINTTTSNGPTAAGWNGVSTFANGTGNQHTLHLIGVGTNGDAAPSSAGTTQALAGTAAGAATAAGAISLTVPIAAAAAMQASATGGLSLTLPLAGAASGSASAAGGISITIPLSATALASALAAGALTTASNRYARPDADLIAGGWAASSGSDLYAMLDEEAADDGDYIWINGFGYCDIRLSDVADPVTSTGHAVVFRAWAPGGAGNLITTLYQSSTVIATRSFIGTLPATAADYVIGLTPTEANSITDYTDLRLRFFTSSGETRVSHAYLDVQRDPVTLAGAAAGAGTAAASLSLTVSLSGAAIAAGAAAAGLTVEGAGAVSLDGAASASASAAGALSLAVPLSGAALTVGSAAGSLTQIVPLAASAAAASLATGGLDISVTLSAAALASALAQAGLTVSGGLEGAADGTASAAASLDLRVNLSAQAVAQAIAAGALAGDGTIRSARPGYSATATARTYRAAAAARAYAVRAPARVYRIAA